MNNVDGNIKVRFHESVEDELLKFAVIVAKFNEKWVYCKHRERDTYEIPGGRREIGESIIKTAKRELYEETGAVEYSIRPICAYSVSGKMRADELGEESYGMLYFAEISTYEEELHSEIERIELFDDIPEKLTYPEIQPLLIKEYKRRLEKEYTRQNI